MTRKATGWMSVMMVPIAIGLLALVDCSDYQSTAASPDPPIHILARPDGAVRLTTPPGSASDQNPTFCPNGTQLVFTRFDEGYNDGPAGLFLLNVGNGAATRLTPAEDQDNVNLPGRRLMTCGASRPTVPTSPVSPPILPQQSTSSRPGRPTASGLSSRLANLAVARTDGSDRCGRCAPTALI